MAISKKGKRSITVNDRVYLWWVSEEYDQTAFDGIQVRIVAEDQALYFKYGLQQAPEKRFLVAALGHDAGSIHLLCPKFENDQEIITPSGISALIKWCSAGPGEHDIRTIAHAWNNKDGILDEQQAVPVYHRILEILNKNT